MLYIVFFFLLCFVLFFAMFSVYHTCIVISKTFLALCIVSCIVQNMQPACAPCAVSNDLIVVVMMKKVENDNGDSGS